MIQLVEFLKEHPYKKNFNHEIKGLSQVIPVLIMGDY